MSNLIKKIRPLGDELFHADGRMDGNTDDETNTRFSQFCKRALKITQRLNTR